MEPRIHTEHISLVGMQKVLRFGADRFELELPALRSALLGGLDGILDRSASLRLFGYWQVVDQATRVYFAGIQVDCFDRLESDHPSGVLPWNLAGARMAWDLGPTTFAVFQRHGVGDTSPWYASIPSGYAYDARFLGDFEVVSYASWRANGELQNLAESDNEVWIPIRARS